MTRRAEEASYRGFGYPEVTISYKSPEKDGEGKEFAVSHQLTYRFPPWSRSRTNEGVWSVKDPIPFTFMHKDFTKEEGHLVLEYHEHKQAQAKYLARERKYRGPEEPEGPDSKRRKTGTIPVHSA